MILGLSIHAFTVLHVVLSLIGIVTGLIAPGGILELRNLSGWTVLFLVTTVLTSVTGFMFPAATVTPAQIVGGISLATLAGALVALYGFHLRGASRWIYVVTAMLALYLNVFVGVVQAFRPLLHTLAPNGSEPPFIIAQRITLLIFGVLGILAVKRFHPSPG